jgi:2,3-diketo-5-methylthio-1-phosphopentane phosphatase
MGIIGSTMKPIILTDFDGTITTEDTLVKLLNTFAPSSWHKIEKSVKAGRMGSRVALRKEFSLFYISKQRYTSFLKKRVTIDPTFKPFLRFVRKKRIPFVILSGGFTLNVRTVLQKYRIRGVPYYANNLLFKRNRFEIEYPYPGNGCRQCGNCKKQHVLKFKNKGYSIIYIGDSTTDRCPVKEADVVFAKWELAEYCTKKKIPYITYNSFRDIRDHLIATLPL